MLGWWKIHDPRYPVARDALVMPASTIASGLTFSAGGRTLNLFRTFLTPKVIDVINMFLCIVL